MENSLLLIGTFNQRRGYLRHSLVNFSLISKAHIYNYDLVFSPACFRQVATTKSVILHDAPSHLVINTQLTMQPRHGTSKGLSAAIEGFVLLLIPFCSLF